MTNLSRAEIIKRLGMAPDQWVFRGQCYDCGEGNHRVCALTQKDSRFCFTLKPKVGKGKVTIGPASFYLLKRYAPELYLQLERGRHWLQLMVEAEASDMRKESMRRTLHQTQKKLSTVRNTARKQIAAWRAANRRGELPEILASLRLMMERKKPEFHEEQTETLWCEQSILELEQTLLQAPVVETVPEVHVPRAAPPVPTATRSFDPIPEIDF